MKNTLKLLMGSTVLSLTLMSGIATASTTMPTHVVLNKSEVGTSIGWRGLTDISNNTKLSFNVRLTNNESSPINAEYKCNSTDPAYRVLYPGSSTICTVKRESDAVIDTVNEGKGSSYVAYGTYEVIQ
jgi:hypothetical protein